jgi:hypothetical protein
VAPERICEGDCAHTAGIARTTLVEHVIELLHFRQVLVAPYVRAQFVGIPISR